LVEASGFDEIEHWVGPGGAGTLDWNVTAYVPEVSLCCRDDTQPDRRQVLHVTVDHLLVDYGSDALSLRCGHLQVTTQKISNSVKPACCSLKTS